MKGGIARDNILFMWGDKADKKKLQQILLSALILQCYARKLFCL